MAPSQRTLLWLLAGVAVLTAAVLWEVLGTVFFAITLVYLVAPAYRALVERGVPPWWASAATSAGLLAAALAVFAPFGVVLYRRRADLMELLRSLPETVPVAVGGYEVVLVVGDLLTIVLGVLRGIAVATARAAPVLALKLTLLGIVVFALLIRKESASRALVAAVPRRHRRVVRRLSERARQMLLAIYVVQAATALATFAVALPLFLALGYPFAFVLALLAGMLQFLPIVGPSLVIAALAAGELLAGDLLGAALVGVLGWMLVAWLPDVIVRPRLAARTARMPGSLYFIGFTGGVLTIGPVGVIAGPVVVGLLQESLGLLAEEADVAPDGSLVETD